MIWKYLEQNVLFPKGFNWIQHRVSRLGLLHCLLLKYLIREIPSLAFRIVSLFSKDICVLFKVIFPSMIIIDLDLKNKNK